MADQNKTEETPSRRQVWRMFDRIAPRYDLLNRLLSFRRDVAWRRIMVKKLPAVKNPVILDLATGTGDVLLAIAKKRHDLAAGVGVDMSAGMLEGARAKVAAADSRNCLRLVRGDAVHLGLDSAHFDAATIAFGIRNVEAVDDALTEMRRVLRPGGRVLILEFSMPANPLFRAVYLLYFRHVLPRIGGWISGDAGAYHYLNRTAETFPCGDAFLKLMSDAGFISLQAIPLTFGIATLYTGEKPAEAGSTE